MPQKDYSSRTVGQIVADRFETARVFARHRIDFCCHGNVPFAEACRNRNVSPALVAEELDRLQSSPSASAPDFSGLQQFKDALHEQPGEQPHLPARVGDGAALCCRTKDKLQVLNLYI